MELCYSIFFEVRPSSEASDVMSNTLNEHQQQLEQLESEKEGLQTELTSKEQIVAGYQHYSAGELEEAIQAFEAVDDLQEKETKMLADMYLEENTVESLQKAFALSPDFQRNAAMALVRLRSDEANEALEALESDQPGVQIEQAWLANDYERVLELANEESLSEDRRTLQLAGNSYLQQGKLKEAEEYAKEIEDINLQIAVKNAQIKNIKDDDDKKKDKKEEEIEKIEKQIEKLEKKKG